MTELALVLYVAYLVLAFGLRSVLQRRRTGSSGFRGVSGRPGSAEWLGGVLFVVAVVAGLAATLLALLDVVPTIARFQSTAAGVVGAALVCAGIVLSLVAQHAMGASWRIGVDESERTALVTTGIFALVRNPFFSATALVAIGLVLMVPSVLAGAALIALLFAVELQVRVVEEPYLLRAQGGSYREYAFRTGRFVPGLGRIARTRASLSE